MMKNSIKDVSQQMEYGTKFIVTIVTASEGAQTLLWLFCFGNKYSLTSSSQNKPV
ncbi:hypothetical protein [Paenibacillus sp. WC2504]|uniref:hypothetical protein n=1 Tax=Paenibacillus sp. WC2504 TaxID=3461403 RepID=UPI0040461BBB